MLASEFGIAHAGGIPFEVGGFDAVDFREGRRDSVDASEKPDQLFDLPAVEFRFVAEHPLFLTWDVAGVPKPSHIPQVLRGMKQIDDWNRAGKVLIGIVPDSFGAVDDHDVSGSAIPAALPGFQIDSAPNCLAVSMAPV